MLRDQLQNYANPMTNISRLIKDVTYIPINRGLYAKEKNIPGYVLVGVIYGPSYLSFDFVLAWYGLIPETVQTFTSVTLNKRKHKRFGNYFGVYTYRDVPADFGTISFFKCQTAGKVNKGTVIWLIKMHWK